MRNLTPWRRLTHGHHPLPFSPLTQEVERFFHPGLEARLDVVERENEIRVRVEVPGIDPTDLRIHLDGDLLTISGEKTEERHEEDEKTGRSYSERQYGSFERKVRLSLPVDPDGVTARGEHGVVTITCPLAAAARPRRIEVK